MKRDLTGKFVQTWDGEAKQRVSVTLTATALQRLDQEALRRGISRSEVIEQMARCLEPSPPAAHRDGSARLASITSASQVVHGSDGNVAGDRTPASIQVDGERERLLRELETERVRLEAILQQMPAGVFIADAASNQVILSNDQAKRLTGYGFEQALPPEDYEAIVPFEALHLDGRRYQLGEYPLVRALRKGEVVSNEEMELCRRDGSRVVISANAAPIWHPEGHIVAAVVVFQDMTQRQQVEAQRRQVEAALQDSTNHLSLALAAAKLGTWSWDAATDVVTLSERAAEIFGIPAGPYMTWTQMQTRLHEADRESARLSVEQAIQEQSDYDIEYRVTLSDGTERWVAAKGRAQYDVAGQVLGMLGVVQDISDRKRAEVALKSSEDRYRTFANAVPQLMWINAADGTAEYFNQPWLEYTGLSLEASLARWPTVIHADDAASTLEYRSRAVQAGEAYEMEVRLKRFDQSYRWHLTRVVPLKDTNGQILQWFGTATDIHAVKQTEAALRQSEERLRLALDAGQMGAWEWNLVTHVQRWDMNQYKLFGLESEGSFVSTEQFLALIHPDDRAIAEQVAMQATRPRHTFQVEFRIIQPSGAVRWLSSQGMVVQSGPGAALHLIGVNFDITERKQAEAEREQLLHREQMARQEAEAANRVKDEFLAVLSHELRSPLNPILGWSKLLQTRTFEPSAVQQALATIERNAKLQTQLIDDLLDISRILRGKMLLNEAPVQLATVIDAALETVRLSAEAKQIHIHRTVASQVGLVSGDASRLQQVVWNLLSNAVKFTPVQGRIEIQLEQLGAEVQIQVSDTGAGISPAFLPHVFESFRQEDGKTTRRFGGLGLGLAIVRYLTELHGGTVQADSPGIGQGATFTVRLPVMPEATALDGQRLPAGELTPPASSVLTGIRVLAVDDEADMRELLLTVLEQSGAESYVAASAAAACAVIDTFKPDVVISDIGMPEVDGYMFLRQFRRAGGQQIPAIALTAYASEYDQQRAFAAGFQRHLCKPIEPEALVRAIAALVKR